MLAASPSPSSALTHDHEHPIRAGQRAHARHVGLEFGFLGFQDDASASVEDRSVLCRELLCNRKRAQRRPALPQALLSSEASEERMPCARTARSSSADARECATSTGVTSRAERVFFPLEELA